MPLAAACARAERQRRARGNVAAIRLAAALPCVVLLLVAPAHAQAPLLQVWGVVNAECKGGVPDDPKTAKACEKRDMVNDKLKRRGCVYQEDGDWWKCPGRP